MTRAPDRHGKVRRRFRRKRGGIDTYLSGAYGSTVFRAGYEAAIAGTKVGVSDPRAPAGTMAWLIESYLRSPRHNNKAEITRGLLRRELDWMRDMAGKYPFNSFRAKHVEAAMSKKEGLAAQNRVRKNFSLLFNYAIKHELMTANPARAADKRQENSDGFHTWTAVEMAQFLAFYPTGSKQRLAFWLAMNTGAARQDLAAMTEGNISDGRISFRRGKTKIGGDFEVMPELANDLSQLSSDQVVLIAHGNNYLPYAKGSLGNLFHDSCVKSGLSHCSLHGIRKGQATIIADAGGSEYEVMSFLAHASSKEGETYTRNANRKKLGDSGLARTKTTQKLSDHSKKVDLKANKVLK